MSHADRFLGRAEVYAAARPEYPAALGGWLVGLGLLAGRVADVGAGTGLFTRLLLAHGTGPGFAVDAVEPNPDMRARLQGDLNPEVAAGRLSVRAGTSGGTGLPAYSVALITAAQAAHWFDPAPTLLEFRRVLRPGGRILFVWNDWRGVQTPFNAAYREVVAGFSREDGDLLSRVPEADLPRFMPGGFEARTFENPVRFTRERLHALAGSVSYLPAPDAPEFPALTRRLDRAFAEHGADGQVTLTYRTHAFLGRPD